MMWAWLHRHAGDLAVTTLQHLWTTVLAVLLGLVVALPVSLAAHRWRRLQSPILATSSVLFTIPSLALFILLLPWTGLSQTTAIIGLAVYTLVVLIRNIVEGLRAVPPQVVEAARAMGYTRSRRLLAVEIPLALPVMLAGVRIATVMTISLVSVAAFIGQGGLGQLFIDGLQRNFATPIIAGIVLTILLSVAADLVLLGLTRLVTPWTRR
jgi:osmoprotectant transport system permease protein